MITATPLNTDLNTDSQSASPIRRSLQGAEPEILAEIYQEQFNIITWQRQLSPEQRQAAAMLLSAQPRLQASMVISPQSAEVAILDTLGDTPEVAVLSQDITQLVDMFCCLFDLKQAGLRLTALDRAMCPRFHVDRVPCRLVTTYQGVATEWLEHAVVDRRQLGRTGQGQSDQQRGLFPRSADIQQLTEGDVALLKGELWANNEGAGLVHRSPATVADQPRLLLTLDFI